MLGSGIVLTGGSAKIEGMVDLGEEVFHMPVRLGIPQYVGGLSGVVHNPIFSTGVGLVLYGARNRMGRGPLKEARGGRGSVKGTLARMRSWFQGNF
jgi:cell division protein FtsA